LEHVTPDLGQQHEPDRHFAGRASFTDWASSQTVDGTEIAWTGESDGNGGRWIALRDERFSDRSIAFYFEVDGSCSGYRVEPYRITEHGATVVAGQLTARLLRSIPFAELEQAARRIARAIATSEANDAGAQLSVIDEAGDVLGVLQIVEGAGPGSAIEVEAQRRTEALGANRSAGGRRPVHDDRFFAEQAQRYERALTSPNPIRTVAAESGYSATAARNHIHEARERDLLTSTTPGRAGGELTSKAIELLRGEQP